ncbi:MAG: hypothetical protein V4542_02200 [Pseudomonadota bacterium]
MKYSISKSPSRAHAVSSKVGHDALVLEGFPTRTGDPSQLQFKDGVWRLGEAVLRTNARTNPYLLNFDACRSLHIALALKEFSYARMRYRAGNLFVIKPQSVALVTGALLTIFRDIEAHEQINTLEDLTQEMLDRWLARWSAKSSLQDNFMVYSLQCLAEYGGYLTMPLRFDPWRGRGPSRVTGKKYRLRDAENSTPRIPEAVAQPLLQWCLRYVENFSQEIILAITRTKNGQSLIPPEVATQLQSVASVNDKVERLIRYHLTRNIGFPSISPPLPSEAKFVRFLETKRTRLSEGWMTGRLPQNTAGITDQQLLLALWQICNALNIRQVGEVTTQFRSAVAIVGLDWQIQRIENTETLLSLRRGSLIGVALEREIRMLFIAAYAMIGYLSGMRDSELQSLKVGCVREERTTDGVANRWKVQGMAWKNKHARGEPEEWVIIEPVARAIEMLESLHLALGSSPQSYLFKRNLRDDFGTGHNDPLGQGIGLELREFMCHVNVLAGRSSMTAAIPDWDGKSWPLNSAQFRRTLAWHIVNRPFGTVAGKIHFKHVHMQVTEGYGGHSESGFAAEIAQEQYLSNLDSLVDRYTSWVAGARLTGPGATGLEQEFLDLNNSTGGGLMVANSARLRELLKNRAARMHPGILNDCCFDPNYALCGGQESPLLDSCQPAKCANSVIDQVHLVRWGEHAQELDDYLKDSTKLQPLQVKRIEAAKLQVSQVLGVERKEIA